MTHADMRVYQKRWQLASERQRMEMLSAQPGDKLKKLWALMASVSQMGWKDELLKGSDMVRARWLTLKKTVI